MLLSNQLRAKARIWFKVVLKFIRATLPHSLKWKRLQATVFIRRGDTKQTPRRMDEFVPKAALLLARCCWLSNNQSYLGHQRWGAESPTLARALVDNPSGGLKNRTAPTRVKKKKKGIPDETIYLAYLPAGGRCQDWGGKRVLVECDDTSVGQQINPALKIHDCINSPRGCSHTEQMAQCDVMSLLWKHTSTRFQRSQNRC